MRGPRAVPLVRSALFVPAHRSDFLRAAERRGADAIILDLEDGVPVDEIDSARRQAEEWLRSRAGAAESAAVVRVHPAGGDDLDEDLGSVVSPSLLGVMLPKVRSVDDVTGLADRLAWHEGRCALPLGSIRIWPVLETPAALLAVRDIARCSRRIAFLGGAAADGGDLAADLGFQATPGGLETLYLRSRVLLEARAAEVPNPITGLVTDIEDDDAVRRFASASRQLGYEGMMVIHPRHVDVVNRVFTPTAEEITKARATLEALDRGGGAQRVGGQMVDTAMVREARRVLGKADAADVTSGEVTR